MQQLIDSIKQKTKELNDLFEEAAMQKIVVKGNCTCGITVRDSAPIAHLVVKFYQEL